MKKFLLVLSCFLATWCSVQAGLKCSTSGSELYGMSQSASMLMASAPAAAPAPEYPAKITNAYYDSANRQIVVEFTAKKAGKVTFNVETVDGYKSGLGETDVEPDGTYKAKIPLNPEWALKEKVSVTIQFNDGVNDGVCGGTGVELVDIPPTVRVGYVSYNAAKNNVTVHYNVYSPNSKPAKLKVYDNATGKVVISKTRQDDGKSGERTWLFSSSKLSKSGNYTVRVYYADRFDCQNFRIDDNIAGYVQGVYYGSSVAKFVYSLKGAYDPHLYINKGNDGDLGTLVKDIKIENTNGVYAEAQLNNYTSVLKLNTPYTACLYDVLKDGTKKYLGIYKDFVRSISYGTGTETHLAFDFRPDNDTHQCDVVVTSTLSYVNEVTVDVYEYNNGGTQEHHFDGKRNEVFKFPYTPGKTYIIYVSAGSEHSERTVILR